MSQIRGKAHVLIVDDEPFVRSAFQLYLGTQGYQTSVASGKADAMRVFADRSSPVDVVLLDLVMPGCHGLDLLRQFRSMDDTVEVIIATGCGSMESAIEALRLGAFDYITKPVVDLEKDLLRVVRKAVSRRNEQHTGTMISEDVTYAKAYINQLEHLAGVLARPESPETVEMAVEELLRHQLGASEALALELRGDQALLVAHWGERRILPPEAWSTEGLTARRIWRSILAAPRCWQALSPTDAFMEQLFPCPGGMLPVLLHVPLSSEPGMGDAERHFLAFRSRELPSPPPLPAPSLLALVLNAAASSSYSANYETCPPQ